MEFKDHLKSSVDIVRTVGEYVRLRKIGARYSGLCPFHTEKTPSFSVNPGHGFYICFGCGKKGDVLDFIQEVENLTFYEALKLLAERNGIPMPARRERNDPETALRSAIYELHEIAAATFTENLWGPNAGEARDYLRKRGLSQVVSEQFGLGLADRSGELLKRVRSRFSVEQLEASGLFGKREDGSLYDRFRGRLMFPIHNESGKVIAFGGRAMRSDEEPKYLNSPETAIYKKSNVLYNLHRAKQAIRTTERTVLVEGYMDVIGVYAAGIKHVVASCGTALTENQVRAMKRHSEHVVVNFDPDTAGSNATEKSIKILLDEGMHIRILELEGGLDPDEYVRKNGAEMYSARLERATGYFLWLADRARRKFDMTSAEGRVAGFENMLLPAIRKISDKLERAAVAGEVAEYLGVDRSLVLKEFRNTPGATRTNTRQQQPKPASSTMSERVLVRSLLLDGEVRSTLLPVLAKSEAARRFTLWPSIEAMTRLTDEGEAVTFSAVEGRLPESPQRDLLSAAVFADSSGEVFSNEQAHLYLGVLQSEDAKLRAEDLRSRLKQAERTGNWDEAFRLTAELTELQRGQSRKTG
ncbi:MAG TPA: DNA primase [Bryobacteraceae bacterium]|nr:DNA primase [Bryobacteraceae bacterium]